ESLHRNVEAFLRLRGFGLVGLSHSYRMIIKMRKVKLIRIGKAHISSFIPPISNHYFPGNSLFISQKPDFSNLTSSELLNAVLNHFTKRNAMEKKELAKVFPEIKKGNNTLAAQMGKVSSSCSAFLDEVMKRDTTLSSEEKQALENHKQEIVVLTKLLKNITESNSEIVKKGLVIQGMLDHDREFMGAINNDLLSRN
ncbi:MAG: hypothetical protein ACI88Z_001207, partial [Sphingobacteriales bacterium]